MVCTGLIGLTWLTLTTAVDVLLGAVLLPIAARSCRAAGRGLCVTSGPGSRLRTAARRGIGVAVGFGCGLSADTQLCLTHLILRAIRRCGTGKHPLRNTDLTGQSDYAEHPCADH